MSNITYPSKTVAGDGGTTYVAGKTVPNTELQGDFDAIANIVNGELDEDNLRSATRIPSAKLGVVASDNVDDHSDDAATALTTTTPGDSSTAGSNLATTNEGEIERLRHRIEALAGYQAQSYYRDSAGSYQNSTWVEPPLRGPNLLANSGFEYHGGSATAAPANWSLVDTPTNVAIEAAADSEAGGHKRSLNITTNTENHGIAQTIQGLKSDTKYIFGVAYKITTGGFRLSVAGGASSGNYQNGSVTDSSAGSAVEYRQLIVKSDSSASDMTFSLLSPTATTDFNVYDVWVYELNDNVPAHVPHIPEQTATHSTEEQLPATFTSFQWNWETVGELGLAQYIPSPGYRIVYDVRLSYTGEGAAGTAAGFEAEYGFRAQLDTGSGASTVDGPYVIYEQENGSSNLSPGGMVTLRHVVENPTPGLTYTFSTDVGAYNDGTADQRMTINPLAHSVQSISKARLTVERI